VLQLRPSHPIVGWEDVTQLGEHPVEVQHRGRVEARRQERPPSFRLTTYLLYFPTCQTLDDSEDLSIAPRDSTSNIECFKLLARSGHLRRPIGRMRNIKGRSTS